MRGLEFENLTLERSAQSLIVANLVPHGMRPPCPDRGETRFRGEAGSAPQWVTGRPRH